MTASTPTSARPSASATSCTTPPSRAGRATVRASTNRRLTPSNVVRIHSFRRHPYPGAVRPGFLGACSPREAIRHRSRVRTLRIRLSVNYTRGTWHSPVRSNSAAGACPLRTPRKFVHLPDRSYSILSVSRRLVSSRRCVRRWRPMCEPLGRASGRDTNTDTLLGSSALHPHRVADTARWVRRGTTRRRSDYSSRRPSSPGRRPVARRHAGTGRPPVHFLGRPVHVFQPPCMP